MGRHIGNGLATGKEGIELFFLGIEGFDVGRELFQFFFLFVGEFVGIVTHIILLLFLRFGSGFAFLCRQLVVIVFPGAVFAIVAREILHNAIALEHKGVVDGAVHEKSVVAHDNHAALEVC